VERAKSLWYSDFGDENHVRDPVAISVTGHATFRGSALAVTGWSKSVGSNRYRALEWITTLLIGLSYLWVAQVIGPAAQPGSKPPSSGLGPSGSKRSSSGPAQTGSNPPSASGLAQSSSEPSPASGPAQPGSKPGSASAPAPARSTSVEWPLPWYIILNLPRDLDELWQKIDRPDLMVVKPDREGAAVLRMGRPDESGDSAPSLWAVQSILVEGRVAAEDASLKASMTIALKRSGAVWVPIRLDDQRVRTAREEGRELLLRMGQRREWLVQLSGPGVHQIQVEFRASIRSDPAKRWLSVPIPEAASTRVDLEFLDRESEIVVGSNEDFGLTDLGEGKPRRLQAHLSPRSKLDVTWAVGEGSGAASAPLLTAQGEIAIDIDADQVRTRASWMIRSVRGLTRRLEIRLDEQDELTDLLVDDQSTGGGLERAGGKLVVRLRDLLRPGQPKRVVMKTRRSLENCAVQRASFTGFPVTSAKEQTGFIGVIQSPNLWVNPIQARGVLQIDPRELPTDLRARPSTNLAFEFREQPFQLDLSIEPLPPLVKAESRTSIWIDAQRARSETTMDFSWVRGRLFDLELNVPRGLQVVSIGPPEIVEHWNLIKDEASAPGARTGQTAQQLKIRLTPSARDQSKVTLKVQALEPIPPAGLARLGLITSQQVISAAAAYELIADRGLVLELDDDSGRVRRAYDPGAQLARSVGRDGPARGIPGDGGSSPLLLSGDGTAHELPVTIKRHARIVTHDTQISAQVSRRSIDVTQQTNLAVRFGALGSLEILVPAAIADRWELMDKEIAERRELGLYPGGSRRYGLTFDRPVLDKLILRFRYRLPLVPILDSKVSRELVLPEITLREGSAGMTKVALSLATDTVLAARDPTWPRVADDVLPQASDRGPVLTFGQEAGDRAKQPFTFMVLAAETVAMPSFLVPRLLIKTALAEDGSRDSVGCWVESHGTDLAFSIPAGARWLGARVDGRVVEQVDYDPTHSQYRLRFPGDAGSHPVLVELEYQTIGRAGSKRRLEPPRLLDGGVVLQSIWEVRLLGNEAILGVPQGWFDESQWYQDGYASKPGTAPMSAGLRGWLVGAGLAPSVPALDEINESQFDQAHRPIFVFSRSGEPVALAIWVVPRSWLVAICSGATLFLGFLAILTRARFRTIWLVFAMLGLLAGMFIQPNVLFLILQAAAIGLSLTLLGLVIRSVIERSRSARLPSRDSSLLTIRPAPQGDSSLDRSSGVGSDDSTAVRVRVPSTIDLVPTPAVEPPVSN
jgi:hypothetical protein